MLLTGAPSCVARVNSRLLQIKPPHCVTRLPRSLNERSFWKASEWRLWLLFYALPCLVDILPLEYWKHLSKLSQAIHILLRETITADEIKRAGKLHTFFSPICLIKVFFLYRMTVSWECQDLPALIRQNVVCKVSEHANQVTVVGNHTQKSSNELHGI